MAQQGVEPSVQVGSSGATDSRCSLIRTEPVSLGNGASVDFTTRQVEVCIAMS